MGSLIEDPTRASRYLAGQMSEAECAEYEARIIQDPEIVAELEATARLKIGLQRLRQTGELGELIAGSGMPSPGRTWILAMAASVAATAIGVAIWLPHSHTSIPVLASVATAFTDRSGHSLSVSSTTALFRSRAERYDAVVELPATRGAVKLRVLPSTPPSDSAHYRVVLAQIQDDDSSGPPVTIGNLKPSAEDGFVEIYADSALLAPGRYRIILTREAGASAAGESDTFVIKVNAHH
ncbi:MAG: hypothetical protein JO042_13575 [Sinobacteraceae bacterium]|nr:hypothetical protein [Nevskiaceae bacterium]